MKSRSHIVEEELLPVSRAKNVMHQALGIGMSHGPPPEKIQSSLRDSFVILIDLVPGVETPGYDQSSLRDSFTILIDLVLVRDFDRPRSRR
jgi:hypothetical protein